MLRGVSVAVFLGVSGVACSCDRSDVGRARSSADRQGESSSADASHLEGPSPIEVVRLVHEQRVAGGLGLVGHHVVPERRSHVLGLLQAMDRLLWANQVLQAAVVSRFGRATARVFDRSRAANAIGVFSHDVEVLDQQVDGDNAVVTIQIAGRVPLDEVKLVRREHRWLIQTDPPITGVADELHRLAEVLVDAARMLDKTAMTPVELKKELDLREAAIGRRIAELTGSASP